MVLETGELASDVAVGTALDKARSVSPVTVAGTVVIVAPGAAIHMTLVLVLIQH